MPGLIACMEPDSPGRHTSNTIDFEYIISGEVWLGARRRRGGAPSAGGYGCAERNAPRMAQ